jgi:transcriptional regulator with XRE-family HTH domain/DNA-binding CsgD family transcriptional regulator
VTRDLAAKRAYTRDYYDRFDRHRRGLQPRQPVGPVIEHLQACRAVGMSNQAIAAAAGVAASTVDGLFRAPGPTVRRRVAVSLLGVTPRRPVTAVGLTRRVRALTALGWSVVQIAAASGVNASTVKAYRRGEVAQCKPTAAGLIAAAYDRLSMHTPVGVGRYERAAASRARAHAQHQGWPPPLAWDDDTIDDPEANPATQDDSPGSIDEVAIARAVSGVPVALNRAEREVAIPAMTAAGVSDSAIARLVGVTPQTILRDRHRLGVRAASEPTARAS